jgi:predicted amidohydrolase YtcJ
MTRQPRPSCPRNGSTSLPTLAAFTIGSAFINHRVKDKGSIEVGKLADLVAVDRDPFERGAAPAADAKVRVTLVEGSPVYD